MKRRLLDVADLNQKEMLTNKEFLIFIANMLFAFGRAGLSNDSALSGINIEDAAIVELAHTTHPDNIYLASILQAHTIVYWSSLLTD